MARIDENGAWIPDNPFGIYLGNQITSDNPAEPQGPGSLFVRMPDGTIQSFPATASNNGGEALNLALQAGGTPIDQNGNTMTVSRYSGAGGGWLVNGQPLNRVYGTGYMPGQEDALRNTGGTVLPPNGTVARPPGAGGLDPDADIYNQLFGLSDVPQIDDINLPDNPQVSTAFGANTDQMWQGMRNANIDDIQRYYDTGHWPTMKAATMNRADVPVTAGTPVTAAQMDLSQIPHTTGAKLGLAQTPEGFDALEFLLSGQGYDPATLARMNSGASDQIAQSATGQRAAARIAAEQAGMTGGGGDLAVQAQIGRQAGDSQTRALNEIAIANAQQGIQNRVTGAGMELQRRTTGAGMQNDMAQVQGQLQQQNEQSNAARQMTGQQTNTGNQQQANMTEAELANQKALADAARQFSAMTQNVTNQQQANQTNTQNQQSREMTRAGQQADFASGNATDYTRALLTKAADAESQNATNTINRNLNNAQLQRQKQIFNVGTGEGRYSQALGGMLSLIGGSNPSPYALIGAQTGSQYQPNLIGSNAFSNLANALSNYKKQAA